MSTEDAYAMTRRLAADEGLLVGISSGADLAGAFRILAGTAGTARRATPAVVVMIFPDGGERYLSESFWNEER